MITIDRGNGIELYDESLLRRVDGAYEDAHESTTWVEYWMEGIDKPVHRSAHVTLKEGIGIEAVLGKLA